MLRRDGGIYDEQTGWSFTSCESRHELVDNSRLAGGGRFLLCVVVLVAAFLVGLSCRHGWRGALAVDWGRFPHGWNRNLGGGLQRSDPSELMGRGGARPLEVYPWDCWREDAKSSLTRRISSLRSRSRYF
jgi:hypothetical protein